MIETILRNKGAVGSAVIDGERRLNIEIDGERYHRNWIGEPSL